MLTTMDNLDTIIVFYLTQSVLNKKNIYILTNTEIYQLILSNPSCIMLCNIRLFR